MILFPNDVFRQIKLASSTIKLISYLEAFPIALRILDVHVLGSNVTLRKLNALLTRTQSDLTPTLYTYYEGKLCLVPHPNPTKDSEHITGMIRIPLNQTVKVNDDNTCSLFVETVSKYSTHYYSSNQITLLE